MATLDSTLYADYAAARAVAGPFSTADGAIPPFNAGDTINFTLMMLQAGSGAGTPYRLTAFDPATTYLMRLRNALGVYASSSTWTRQVNASGVSVTTFRNGVLLNRLYGTGDSEIQDVTFASVPLSGRFTITFPPHSNDGWGPVGTTSPIATNATADTIAAEIERLPWSNGDIGVGIARRACIVTRLSAAAFRIDWNNAADKPLSTVNISDTQFGPWWTGSLVLQDAFTGAPTGTFNDLFDPAQGPVYFEVLITPPGYGQSVALQHQVTQGGYTPPPPVYTPPGGSPPGATLPGGGIAFYDGDNSVPLQVTDWRISDPIEQDLDCVMYSASFQQFRANYARAAFGATCPIDANAFFIRDGELQDLGGGVAQWDRVYSRVPSSRVEYEVISYPYQQTFTLNAVNSIATATLTRRAKVFYDYFRIAPDSIPLERLPRVIVFNNAFTGFDGFQNLGAGATTIARDAELSRWMGDIWQRKRWQIKI